MTIPVASKDQIVGALTITQASLHTGFPGLTGANEMTGGTPAYTRQSIVFGASSGGVRAMTAGVSFDVPAATVRWIGFWDGTTFKFCAPNGGGTPRNFVLGSGAVVSTNHGFADGTKVTFYNGTPPGGLTEGAVYFVRDSTADTFKVAATAGGTAIALSSAASFQCVVAPIVEDVYASQGTHTLSTASIGLPD